MSKLLKQHIVDKAKSDDDLRYKLSKSNKVKISTIDRWLKSNDVMLTTATNLDVISEHYALLVSELLEEENGKISVLS